MESPTYAGSIRRPSAAGYRANWSLSIFTSWTSASLGVTTASSPLSAAIIPIEDCALLERLPGLVATSNVPVLRRHTYRGPVRPPVHLRENFHAVSGSKLQSQFLFDFTGGAIANRKCKISSFAARIAAQVCAHSCAGLDDPAPGGLLKPREADVIDCGGPYSTFARVPLSPRSLKSTSARRCPNTRASHRRELHTLRRS
jgi:hypothetical protein